MARALIKDSAVVIFDDSLSAVDAKTESLISSNISDYISDKTAIFITHRIATSIEFDRIIVMEKGRIKEQGNHQQLMELKGDYAAMYNRQIHTEKMEFE